MVNTLATLPGYPNLPVLPFDFCNQVLDDAGLSQHYKAKLAGISRQSLWQQRTATRGSGALTAERLSLLTYRVLLWQRRTEQTRFAAGTKLAHILNETVADPLVLAKTTSDILPAHIRKMLGV